MAQFWQHLVQNKIGPEMYRELSAPPPQALSQIWARNRWLVRRNQQDATCEALKPIVSIYFSICKNGNNLFPYAKMHIFMRQMRHLITYLPFYHLTVLLLLLEFECSIHFMFFVQKGFVAWDNPEEFVPTQLWRTEQLLDIIPRAFSLKVGFSLFFLDVYAYHDGLTCFTMNWFKTCWNMIWSPIFIDIHKMLILFTWSWAALMGRGSVVEHQGFLFTKPGQPIAQTYRKIYR